ncbi:hypothetical protein [Lactococcus formosensis]|jgi:Predicted small secreted protein|uniref:Uncharacterized protein n=1 Tax=Lactococcus formosensis TaxID=1281486 RepID=A0A9Q8Y2D8_9LACT|nr:hypothetical protein [Lactococcus formosensis]MCH1722821.1 hypothetical protein [Lactococcus formosensis]MCO7179751.1 hypothetical protein [Lactococcus formosensis]MDG6110843.1 hypothetical protein [Lactococcus formosensis]MDG6113029.1 hypothetical protein [Lactococcus formosensis]MDG6114962.1 hypothetical protein [Lactococcus formosensis]
MKKYLKVGLGLLAGVAGARVLYQSYKHVEENLRAEVIQAVREAFADRDIQAVWIFEDADRGAIYKGGVIFGENHNINFEIDGETLEITELGEEYL